MLRTTNTLTCTQELKFSMSVYYWKTNDIEFWFWPVNLPQKKKDIANVSFICMYLLQLLGTPIKT